MAFALSVLALLLGATSNAHARGAVAAKACPGHVQGVYYYRGMTRKWERKMDKTQSKSQFNASKVRSCDYVVWVAHSWQSRATKARALYVKFAKERAARSIPQWLVDSFSCIHGYEGAWDADTGNGYYGGLQMDLSFQSIYGAEFLARWGTANKWPVWAQLKAAVRAYQSGRGFYPWPNTARACGLI